MKETAFILRTIEPWDIGGAMKLSNEAGWNQTEKDWKLLIENPQNVCILAEHKKKIIGTTIAIDYSNKIAWIGMVLVAKEYRGQRISKSLLTDIFKKLETFQSIKLDATPEGQQVYKKFDFKDEYLIFRMTTASLKNLFSEDGSIPPEPIQEKDIQEIIALDEITFGANRSQLIESLVKEYPHKAWLLKQNNHVTGFALGRDGNKYNQVGPVVSSNIIEAQMLITKALNKLMGRAVVVDVPGNQEDLINWLNSIGFVKQRHFVRMYKNKNPFPGSVDKQFLICGPEFG